MVTVRLPVEGTILDPAPIIARMEKAGRTQSETSAVKEMYAFLEVFARIADPDVKVTDTEINAVAGDLAERVDNHLTEIPEHQGAAIIEGLENILDGLESESRVDQAIANLMLC